MTDRLRALSVVATDAISEAWGSPAQRIANEVQKSMGLELRTLREKGSSPEEYLATEKFLLRWERAEFANATAMETSLDNAVREIEAAEKMLPRVRDAARYAEVDATHAIPKRRVGGLPRDDARVFFGAHATRLGNLSKARAPAVEKFLLAERRRNIRAAERAYKELQRSAVLGRPVPDRGRDGSGRNDR